LDAGDDSDEIHLKLAKRAKEITDVALYTGVDGRHVFKEVFATAMTDHDATIQKIIDKLNENDAVLIEGHIPSWLMKQLTRRP
jgi:UDP-N-acetylmuramyl pentapeptide synthase